jgi:hypothetical protein
MSSSKDLWAKLESAKTLAITLIWDIGLTVINLVTPNHKPGTVIPPGKPGHNGIWPTYEPPKPTDSRSPCPALNAMANHGIFPRDGRNIPFKEMTTKIHETFNFADSFCWFVPHYFAGLIGRDYETGTVHLEELALHNGIEHDASLTRHDTAQVPDQSKPDVKLVEALLAMATGPNKELTAADLSKYSTIRRCDAKAVNPEFSLAKQHKSFGSSNSATMIEVMGPQQDVLRSFLIDEKIPAGWEPWPKSRMGITMVQFNLTVAKVEWGIKEDKKDL